MIVISDTTPIISLLKANQLELLQKLYRSVLIPRAVYRELIENPRYKNKAEIIKIMDFLKTMEIENVKSVNILRAVTGLDAGESEALIMYDEQKAELLLMDERKGRSVAKQLGIRYIGTAGILMLAYDKSLIQAEQIKDCIDLMLKNGIRLDKKVCNTVMNHVGLGNQY